MVTCGMCVRYQKCIDGGQIHDDVESAVLTIADFAPNTLFTIGS